ncbi:MAG: hypothetical protein COA85_13465 [Robiginitomaculum sp.]|nr:MAG: hypothetical protein COA85_13465 [Robiginitomaculum sp.]
MNTTKEIYKKTYESRVEVINRAIELADRERIIVIICADLDTPPVMIHPGDTFEQTERRMSLMERQGAIMTLIAWGVMAAIVVTLVVLLMDYLMH